MSEEFKKKIYTLKYMPIFLVYFLINNLTSPNYEFTSYLDQHIPLIQEFSIFWLSFPLLLVGSIIYGLVKAEFFKFKKFINSLIIIQIIAYLFHLVIPSTLTRPEATDILTKLAYWVDNPTNLMPSLHVADSVIVGFFLNDSLSSKYYKSIIWLWICLIIVSTLFIKQHVLVDVITGIILSSLTHFFFSKDEIKN